MKPQRKKNSATEKNGRKANYDIKFFAFCKKNFNRILLDEKMGDYELQICNKNVSSPLEHSYGLMLKKKREENYCQNRNYSL